MLKNLYPFFSCTRYQLDIVFGSLFSLHRPPNFHFKVTFFKLLPIVLNPSILGYSRFFSTVCLIKQILGRHYISQKHILNF